MVVPCDARIPGGRTSTAAVESAVALRVSEIAKAVTAIHAGNRVLNNIGNTPANDSRNGERHRSTPVGCADWPVLNAETSSR